MEPGGGWTAGVRGTTGVRGGADWMSRLPEGLLDVPLYDLALPGSHDSMSYCLDKSSPVLKSEFCLLRVMDKLLPCWTRPYVARWATTQDCSISTQCELGVRFFDLRIAKRPARGDIYFHHGLYTTQSVRSAVRALDGWLQLHPAEVAVASLSHFDGLTEDDHAHLADDIIALFRDRLCPPQATPTLRSCWSSGQQLIVSYDNQTIIKRHPELWASIPYRYADSSSPDQVIRYLEDQKAKGKPGFFASGLNLTEDAVYVASHPCSSMKTMTMDALAPLLAWAGEQRCGAMGGVNIVCCDFIGLSQFCSLIIGLNYKLTTGQLGS